MHYAIRIYSITLNLSRLLLILESHLYKEHLRLKFLKVTAFFFKHYMFKFESKIAPDIETKIRRFIGNFQNIVYLIAVIMALDITPVE